MNLQSPITLMYFAHTRLYQCIEKWIFQHEKGTNTDMSKCCKQPRITNEYMKNWVLYCLQWLLLWLYRVSYYCVHQGSLQEFRAFGGKRKKGERLALRILLVRRINAIHPFAIKSLAKYHSTPWVWWIQKTYSSVRILEPPTFRVT